MFRMPRIVDRGYLADLLSRCCCDQEANCFFFFYAKLHLLQEISDSLGRASKKKKN